MKFITGRGYFRFVALGYAVTLAIAAALLYGRHLEELKYPAEASGGMWAVGDLILYIFIACLFMIPTIFLIWAVTKFESLHKVFSKIVLALSLSGPVCLGVLALGRGSLAQSVSNLCLYRLLWSPFILVGIGVSWLVFRFYRAGRLVLYSLLIESLTLLVAVVMVVHTWGQVKR